MANVAFMFLGSPLVACGLRMATLAGSTTPAGPSSLVVVSSYESGARPVDRSEGLAFLRVDLHDGGDARLLGEISLAPDLEAHDVFVAEAYSRLYVTAFGMRQLTVIGLEGREPTVRNIELSDCKAPAQLVAPKLGSVWYLTCMGGHRILVGDRETDEVLDSITASRDYRDDLAPYIQFPYAIVALPEIDRLLVTSTMNVGMMIFGEVVTELELSSRRAVAVHKTSLRESPSGSTPFRLAVLGPPFVVFVTNLRDGTLWQGSWREGRFLWNQADDLTKRGQKFTSDVKVRTAARELLVASAHPGVLNIYEIGEGSSPALLSEIDTAPGAMNIALDQTERYALIQNNLLGQKELSDGSVTVVDLAQRKVIAELDLFKSKGYRPKSITVLNGSRIPFVKMLVERAEQLERE